MKHLQVYIQANEGVNTCLNADYAWDALNQTLCLPSIWEDANA